MYGFETILKVNSDYFHKISQLNFGRCVVFFQVQTEILNSI
jgi:hypothetical protein